MSFELLFSDNETQSPPLYPTARTTPTRPQSSGFRPIARYCLLTVRRCVACKRSFFSSNLGRLGLQPRVPEHYSRYAREGREVIGKKVIVGDLDVELLLQEPE
jgi:hypothetical protein